MNHLQEDLRWLNIIRDIEFEKAVRLSSGVEINNVLEIGSGTGYIFNKLKDIYPNVMGLEVEGSSYSRLEHGIQLYDGVNIPLKNEDKFDLIISFHVLEHAKNLNGLLSSCYESLSSQGIMIHVLPSPTWRILTTLFWPLGGLAHVLRRLNVNSNNGVDGNPSRSNIRWRWLLSRALPKAHGERGGPITEAYFFSRHYWSRTFKDNGFIVSDVLQSEVVYWGNDFVRQGLSLEMRRLLCKLIGSSSNIYVLKKI